MKSYFVTTEVEIHAVSCPGVWLCPTGDVSLRITTNDDFYTSKSLPAKFPLLYHESFLLSKYYYGVTTLKELEEEILDEPFRVTLIQDGKKLANFSGTLKALLNPPFESNIPGVDIHLLLNPTRIFPGILSPQLEMSTRTTIRETYCNIPKSRALVIERRRRNSESRRPRRTRPVCHSRKYHLNKNCRTKSAPQENATLSPSIDASDERYCRKPCSKTAKCNSLNAKARSKICRCQEQRKPYNPEDYQLDASKSSNQSDRGSNGLSNTKSYIENGYKYDTSTPLKLYKGHDYGGDCRLCDKYDNYFGRFTKISYEPCAPKPCPSLASRLHERLKIVLTPSKKCNTINDDMNKMDREGVTINGDDGYQEEFHKNLRDFYKELHHKACRSPEGVNC